MNHGKTMNLEKFLSVAKALSDSQRLRAFMALRNGELCACQIIELLCLAPSTVSKHMSILKQAGLIQSRKDSRWVYYRMKETADNDTEINKIIDLTISLLLTDELICRDQKALETIAINDQLCTNHQ